MLILFSPQFLPLPQHPSSPISRAGLATFVLDSATSESVTLKQRVNILRLLMYAQTQNIKKVGLSESDCRNSCRVCPPPLLSLPLSISLPPDLTPSLVPSYTITYLIPYLFPSMSACFFPFPPLSFISSH